ncbi:unnamed protein product [Echinostoma caproni]|uniref:DUF4210 domain-containing protein n=1 Tax=Echinostoma caproni TaxID=27848 RepID=A0A183ATE2_9TREM|nr:unnamed protein product [Echinostoma caproni]
MRGFQPHRGYLRVQSVGGVHASVPIPPRLLIFHNRHRNFKSAKQLFEQFTLCTPYAMNPGTSSRYGNSDTEESSDADSAPNHGTELDTIFELDEASVFSSRDLCSNQSRKRDRTRPPLGRLRRETPRTAATTQQLEFPGIFVEGFRDGHVGFNIPGVMQDSLKPTDSIEVKINLFTPEKQSDFDVTSTHHRYPDCSSRFGSIAGSYASPQKPSNTGTSSRFGMSWFQDNNANDPSASRFDPLETTNPNMHSIQTQPSFQPSESSFGLGTMENTRNESGSLHAGNRFFSAHHQPPFGHNSTDSGLHSNGGLAPDLCCPDNSALTSEYSELPSRFLRFGIR